MLRVFCSSVLEKIGQGDELNPDSLVPDLLQFVHEDNEKFQNEMQAWDLEQQRKNQSTEAEQGCMDVDTKPRELCKGLR